MVGLECFGKMLSIVGVALLVFSISPSSDFKNPNDRWLMQQINWVRRYLKQKPGNTSTVDVNPIMLYSGLVLSIVGIILS